MLGIEDPWVFAAYVLCLASTMLCIVWGVWNWNREEPRTEPDTEIRHWIEEEQRLEEEL